MPLNMHGHANTSEEELLEIARERDALRAEVAELRGLLIDLTRGGEHDGPCTNADDPYDSCELHLEAHKTRQARVLAYLQSVG